MATTTGTKNTESTTPKRDPKTGRFEKSTTRASKPASSSKPEMSSKSGSSSKSSSSNSKKG